MNSASLAWLTHCKVCRNSPLNNSKTLSSTLSANSAGGSRRTILRSSSPDALANTPNAQFVAPPTSSRKQGQTACSNQAPGFHEVYSRLHFLHGLRSCSNTMQHKYRRGEEWLRGALTTR